MTIDKPPHPHPPHTHTTHATADELIPPAQMQRNYEAARGVAASRRIVVFPGGKHNDTWLEPNYYESITGWVAGL